MAITLEEIKMEAQRVVKGENLDVDTVWDYVKDYYSEFGDKVMNQTAEEIYKLLEKKN